MCTCSANGMESAGNMATRLVSEAQAEVEHEEELSDHEQQFSTKVGGGNMPLKIQPGPMQLCRPTSILP